MRRILVHFGAHPIFEGKTKRASKRKCLLALILHNEAEGTRTLNLRIDSPMFVAQVLCLQGVITAFLAQKVGSK